MQKKIDLKFDTLPTVKNTLNARLFPTPGEINTMPSRTVPDQALPMREILRRFANGMPLDAGRIPIYDDENDLPDFNKMDLADREAYAEQYKLELAELNQRIQSSRKSPGQSSLEPGAPSAPTAP